MTPEEIVKAMKEAGLGIDDHGVTDIRGEDGLWVEAIGTLEAWTRFRGVPLDEVEKAVRSWVSTVNLVLRANKVTMQLDADDTWDDVFQLFRGGES